MSSTTMTTVTTPTVKRPFDGSGLYFKPVAAATFIAGLYFHLTRLVIGTDLTQQLVVTPTVDKIFLVPMAYAAVAGLLLWNRVVHPNRAHKIVYRVIVVYMTISLPFHFRTFITGNTDLFWVFPEWYSVFFLFMVSAMLLFVWRLTIRPWRSAPSAQ
jgi:hypothetical protein